MDWSTNLLLFVLNVDIVSPGDGCKPLGHHDQPPNMTLPPTPYPLYSVTEYGGVKGVHQMKAEIFARGPISCGIVASTHFVNYTGGILQIEFSPGAQLKHEVSVVGWGVHEDKGVSSAMKPEMYWVVRNSYGRCKIIHYHCFMFMFIFIIIAFGRWS
eukprot:SAG31_NODE_120_length_23892_cov_10.545623_22_plen_157_part_00